MRKASITLILLILSLSSFAQAVENTDLKIVLENLNRTRDDLIKATQNLTPQQWDFKESPERWSIAEIVEHLGNWELMWAREIVTMSQNKPQPELKQTCRPDSYYHDFIMEEKQHNANNFSKPNGFIKGKDTILWFTKLRNDNIKFAEGLKINLRDYFEMTASENPRNMYNVFIYQWGHIDRHLRQVNKIKTHPNFPK